MRFQRFHQLRTTPTARRRNSEVGLAPSDFVLPLFVHEALKKPQNIKALPGVCQYSLGSVVRKVEQVLKTGVNKFLIFGIPKIKTIDGANAYDPDSIVSRVIQVLKKKFGQQIELQTDVCLCSYLKSGHCGLLNKNGTLRNDATLKIIQKIAQVHATAGVDWVAPSGMCDGAVAAIRQVIPKKTKILGYSAKFASSFYGPFRAATDCAPTTGDRQTYQLNPANAKEALAEVKADLEEGAHAVMVKPAGPYLDVITKARQLTRKPLYAYQVSGEYVSLVLAIRQGYLGQEAIHESLLGIKRAGADRIITYFADRLDFW